MDMTIIDDVYGLFRRSRGERDAALERDKQRAFVDQLSHLVHPVYKCRGWATEQGIDVISDAAHVTRSLYGYQVLNAQHLGIVDVDFVLQEAPEFVDETPKDFLTVEAQTKLVTERIEYWAASKHWSNKLTDEAWRAYRTAAGMRLIRTDAVQPLDETFDYVCDYVDADPLYRDIAKEQLCFRARLTAKPIRVGLQYPRWDDYDEGGDGWSHIDRAILPMYDAAADALAGRYKTCELIAEVGSGVVAPELEPLIQYHDDACKVCSSLPLEPAHASEFSPSDEYLQTVRDFAAKYRTNGGCAEYEAGPATPDLIWALLTDKAKDAIKDLDANENKN